MDHISIRKKTYKKDWDNLTIKDLMTIKPSFTGVIPKMHKLGKTTYDKYMKRLNISVNTTNFTHQISKSNKTRSWLVLL